MEAVPTGRSNTSDSIPEKHLRANGCSARGLREIERSRTTSSLLRKYRRGNWLRALSSRCCRCARISSYIEKCQNTIMNTCTVRLQLEDIFSGIFSHFYCNPLQQHVAQFVTLMQSPVAIASLSVQHRCDARVASDGSHEVDQVVVKLLEALSLMFHLAKHVTVIEDLRI